MFIVKRVHKQQEHGAHTGSVNISRECTQVGNSGSVDAEKYTVHSAQCTVCTAQCTVQCTVHSAHCIVHSAQCTVHSAHYTVHSASCTVRSAVHTGGRWAPAELLPVLSYCLHLALLLLLCSLLHFAGTAFL